MPNTSFYQWPNILTNVRLLAIRSAVGHGRFYYIYRPHGEVYYRYSHRLTPAQLQFNAPATKPIWHQATISPAGVVTFTNHHSPHIGVCLVSGFAPAAPRLAPQRDGLSKREFAQRNRDEAARDFQSLAIAALTPTRKE